MIRVLMINAGLRAGGIEESIMSCYRHIDRSKVQFDFLLTTDEDSSGEKHYYEEEFQSLGGHIYTRPTRGRHPVKSTFEFFRIIKSNPDIKVVHIHNDYSIKPTIDVLLAKMAGVPVRIVHSRSDTQTHKNILHKLLRPFMRVMTTHYFAVSGEAGISMFGKGAKEKLIIVPPAREMDTFRYDADKRGVIRNRMDLNSKFVVIHVGRLAQVKNQLFLLEAFARTLKTQPDAVLLIAGEGEMRTQIADKMKELGIQGSVRLLGMRSDIPDLLQAADLFVLPSFYEGLPGVAIEAQAAGLPCLISDKVTRECKVIDAVEFLPIDRDPDIWAERMLAYRDFERKDTMEEIRKAGFDAKEAAKRLEEFYLSAVQVKIKRSHWSTGGRV